MPFSIDHELADDCLASGNAEEKWFTPAEILKMVTHDNAELLGLTMISRIVRKERLRLLNVRITDIGKALQPWGIGSAKVLANHTARQIGTTSQDT